YQDLCSSPGGRYLAQPGAGNTASRDGGKLMAGTVRKRVWTTCTGEEKVAWVVDYRDQHGKRHIKTFVRRREADAGLVTVLPEVRDGIHTPEAASITVKEAAERWLKECRREGREAGTLRTYEQYVWLYIVPLLGHYRLARLTTPIVKDFRNSLLDGEL